MTRGDTLHDVRPTDVDEPLAVDEVHRVLADRCRRAVLADLAARFHPVPLYDLTHRVAATVADGPPTDATYREVRAALEHDHLPTLEAAGLVQRTPVRVELTATGLHVERLQRAFTASLRAALDDA
ncbi:DUF7344 domain-containing protein [Halomarina rubra]|uniref:DUF7344 domain-containing protein n=1 Tax=Halomarina rubra TaxID=2071873 RepID=A0ABD6AZW2_9EURY|nr:hypothetical protein [Halomarina rubra]